MIHFRDAQEVLQILRDMVTYMSIQNRNDELGNMIINRAMRILEDNDNIKTGETNGTSNTKQTSQEDSDQ